VRGIPSSLSWGGQGEPCAPPRRGFIKSVRYFRALPVRGLTGQGSERAHGTVPANDDFGPLSTHRSLIGPRAWQGLRCRLPPPRYHCGNTWCLLWPRSTGAGGGGVLSVWVISLGPPCRSPAYRARSAQVAGPSAGSLGNHFGIPTAPWGITVCWEFAYKNTQKKQAPPTTPLLTAFVWKVGRRGAQGAHAKRKTKQKGSP
jgi:hypothetical protein